jgi:hypothetical protein
MSLRVSAHGAIIRRYINKPYTIELCILYGSIFVPIIVCYSNLKKYSVLLSLLFNDVYMHRLCFILLYKCIKQVFKLIKSLETLKIKILNG